MGMISDLFNHIGKKEHEVEANVHENKNENDNQENKNQDSKENEKEMTGKEENVKPNENGKKENKAKAHIYNLIIVDESGSMSHLRTATLSGINETIGTIKSAQKEFGDTQSHTLTLVTFDSGSNRPDVRTMIDNQPIDNVKEFNDYMPTGCTPLYDAMGQSLTKLHQRIKDDDDATAVVTVLTDGLENASREWNAKSLRKLIEQLKEQGWSFSYMGSAHNVKEVTDLLSIENVVEFSHDQLGATSTWEHERSSRRSYFKKMGMMYSKGHISKEELMNEKRRYAKEYYGDRVTPDHITSLGDNEIFVFGSNAAGQHTGGAAAFATQHFGAVFGQGEGLQGQSYAIPTMEGLDNLEKAVERFITFADQHQDLRFLVTRVGCGIAGYDVQEIAPLFKGCIHLENVALPVEFWKILGLNMNIW